jgi:DNA-binding LacI/PurR family transcriptional regulator
MSGKLKIREIAAQTGLSISTVSRVLSGKSNTSVAARQRILGCAKQQGVLDSLSTGRLLFNNVTVFAPARAFDVRMDIFYYKVVEGIQRAVENQEIRVVHCGIEESDADIPLFLKRISDPACEAAILVGIDDQRVLEIAADIGKPCVLLNGRDPTMRLDVVSPDHHLIGEFSANYLLDQGHRNILVLMCLRRSTMERRLRGIRDAHAERGLEFDEKRLLVTTTGFGASEAREAISTYLATHAGDAVPSAILAGGDFLATGAVEALLQHGLLVPGNMSLMSMDGINLSNIHDVPLTTVHVPRDDMGQEAVRLLQRRMMCPEAPPCSLLLNGHLVVGGSVRRMSERKRGAVAAAGSHGLYEN